MSNLVSKTRRIWGRLQSATSAADFLSQRVSTETLECPYGSIASDDVWYFDQRLCGAPDAWRRKIDWNVEVGPYRLTHPVCSEMLLVAKGVCIMLMKGAGRGHSALGTVKRDLAMFLRLLAFVNDGSRLERRATLMSLTGDDGATFVKEISQNWAPGANTPSILRTLLRRVYMYGASGQLDDALSRAAYDGMVIALEELFEDDASRPNFRGVSEASASPFSNDYCLGLMRVHDFFIHELADDICSHLAEISRCLRSGSSSREVRERYREYLKKNSFQVKELPFLHDYEFPAKDVAGLMNLAAMLQAGNLQRVAMGTAGRQGELLWMERGCLSRFVLNDKEADFISSRTFKNSTKPGGDSIGWPVSVSVGEAVRAQEALATAAESEHLWLRVRFDGIGGRLTSHTPELVDRFAKAHRLDVGSEETAYLQRFRPTMALLLITARNGHPYLVKRALGHAELETTLAYLNMNEHLQADLAALRSKNFSSPEPEKNWRIERRDQELDGLTLENILLDNRSRGMNAKILGPGVIIFAHADDTTFAGRETHPDALKYTLEKSSKKDIRTHPTLARWFEAEALRIVVERPSDETLLPPRLAAHLYSLRWEAAKLNQIELTITPG